VLCAKGIFRGLNVPPRTSRRDATDVPISNVDCYREKAQEIRSPAWRSRSVRGRLELFEIAALFERMADRVERRLRAAADERLPMTDGGLVSGQPVFRGYGPRISSPRASGPRSAMAEATWQDDLEEMLRRLARDFDDAAEDIDAGAIEVRPPEPRS